MQVVMGDVREGKVKKKGREKKGGECRRRRKERKGWSE